MDQSFDQFVDQSVNHSLDQNISSGRYGIGWCASHRGGAGIFKSQQWLHVSRSSFIVPIWSWTLPSPSNVLCIHHCSLPSLSLSLSLSLILRWVQLFSLERRLQTCSQWPKWPWLTRIHNDLPCTCQWPLVTTTENMFHYYFEITQLVQIRNDISRDYWSHIEISVCPEQTE